MSNYWLDSLNKKKKEFESDSWKGSSSPEKLKMSSNDSTDNNVEKSSKNNNTDSLIDKLKNSIKTAPIDYNNKVIASRPQEEVIKGSPITTNNNSISNIFQNALNYTSSPASKVQLPSLKTDYSSDINSYRGALNNTQAPVSNTKNTFSWQQTPSEYKQMGVYSQPEVKQGNKWTDVLYNSLAQGQTQLEQQEANAIRMAAKPLGIKSLNETLDNSVNNKEKLSSQYDEQLKDLTGAKKFVATGLEALPGIITPMVVGGGAGSLAKLAGAGKVAEKVATMTPFGLQAAGGYARQAENEGASYGQQVAYGILGGLAEAATEAPIMTKWLDLAGGKFIDNGAKTLLGRYGKQGLQYLKNAVAEGFQEAIVDPITGLAEKAVYNPNKAWYGDNGVVDTKQMGQDAYTGIAMSVMLTALGLPSNMASHKLASSYIEKNKIPSQEELQQIDNQTNNDVSEIEQATGVKLRGQLSDKNKIGLGVNESSNVGLNQNLNPIQAQATIQENDTDNSSEVTPISNVTAPIENKTVVEPVQNTQSIPVLDDYSKMSDEELDNNITMLTNMANELTSNVNEQNANEVKDKIVKLGLVSNGLMAERDNRKTAQQGVVQPQNNIDTSTTNVQPLREKLTNSQLTNQEVNQNPSTSLNKGTSNTLMLQTRINKNQTELDAIDKLIASNKAKGVKTPQEALKRYNDLIGLINADKEELQYINENSEPQEISKLVNGEVKQPISQEQGSKPYKAATGDILKKQPWQMTKEEAKPIEEYSFNGILDDNGKFHKANDWEHHSDVHERLYDNGLVSIEPGKPAYEITGWKLGDTFVSVADVDKTNGDVHKAFIQKALSEGKPVPQEVLNEYPDLNKETAEPVKTEQAKGTVNNAVSEAAQTNEETKPGNEVMFIDEQNRNNAGVINKVNSDGTLEIKTPENNYYTVKHNGTDYETVLSKPSKDEIPIDDRLFNDKIADKSVNAYQFEHPELKGYIQSEANVMLGDLQRSVKGEKNFTKSEHYNDGVKITGNKRITSPEIATLLDQGHSYKQIETALNNIIKDSGKENTPVSKKVEAYINDRLSNGYTDWESGTEIPANDEYVNVKNAIEGQRETNVQATNKPSDEVKTDKGINTKEEVKQAETKPEEVKNDTKELIDTSNFTEEELKQVTVAGNKAYDKVMRRKTDRMYSTKDRREYAEKARDEAKFEEILAIKKEKNKAAIIHAQFVEERKDAERRENEAVQRDKLRQEGVKHFRPATVFDVASNDIDNIVSDIKRGKTSKEEVQKIVDFGLKEDYLTKDFANNLIELVNERLPETKEEPKLYRYYLTERPASMGTQPKGTVNIVNFDDKQDVPEIGGKAWGYVEYKEPLTDAQIKDYELKAVKEEQPQEDLTKPTDAQLKKMEHLREKAINSGQGYAIFKINDNGLVLVNVKSQFHKSDIRGTIYRNGEMSTGHMGGKEGTPIELPKAEPKEVTLDNWLDTINKSDVDFDLAYRAYSAISFEPDKRAAYEQNVYVEEMKELYDKVSKIAETDNQKKIAIEELNRFKDKYLQLDNEVLNAKSKTMSSMITGSARFPVEKNRQKLEYEHRKYVEFEEWKKKAEKSILKKVEGASLGEFSGDVEYDRLIKEVDFAVDVLKDIEAGKGQGANPALFRNSLRDKIMRSLNNGNIQSVKKVIDYMKEKEKALKKPVFTAQNGIWKAIEDAEVKAKTETPKTGTDTIKQYDGASIVRNNDIDRIQIFFDEKPSKEITTELSKSGWHFSRSNNNAWQRKITSNAEYSAKKIVDKFYNNTEQSVEEVPSQFKGRDESVGIVAPGIIVGNAPKNSRPVMTDEEVEKRWTGAKGIKKTSVLIRAKNWLTEFSHMGRTYRYVDEKNAEFAEFKKEMTQYSKYYNIAAANTEAMLKDITGNLGNNTYDVFSRYVVLKDLQEEAELGHILPFGLTGEQVDIELNNLAPYISDNVTDAVKKRQKYWNGIKENYIKAMDSVGFHVAERFNRENYFRHQVLDRVRENQSTTNGTSGKAKISTGRGFLKQRNGSELDINTDYLQAEYEVMAQMIRDTKVAEMQRRILDRYDISAKLKAEAKKQTDENLKDLKPKLKSLVERIKKLRQNYSLIDDMNDIPKLQKELDDLKAEMKSKVVTWKSLVPDGYTTMQLREGNQYYTATTLAEKMANTIIDNAPKMVGVDSSQLKTALAVGKRYPDYVMDENLIKTLQQSVAVKDSNAVVRLNKKAMTMWKRWVLGLNPNSFLRYNIRNMTGDTDKAISADPRILKYLKRATSEIHAAYKYGSFTPELLEYFNRTGFGNTTYAQELGDISSMDNFEKFYNEKRGIKIKNPLILWTKFTENVNNERESLIRYSAYLRAKELLKKGKPIYWASKPAEIDGLHDINDKAYKLANDLIGAYDEVSEFGKIMRDRYIPFFSWLEVNFKGYTQMLKNNSNMNIIEKQLKYKGKNVNTGTKAEQLLLNNSAFITKAVALSVAMAVWNTLLYSDAEDDLPEDVKNTVHIIFGYDKDGNIRYFNRLGSLSDFLEWFGLSGISTDIKDLQLGRKTGLEQFEDMLKRPVNKFVSGFNPFIKTGGELLMGKKLYPDIFNPSTIRDKRTYMGQNLGVSTILNKVLGIPQDGGAKDSVLNLVSYKTDPLANSYYSILDKKQQYEKNVLGQYPSQTFSSSPKSLALYYYKLALKYNETDMANKYLQQYYDNGGTDKGIEQSLKMMSPTYGLVEDSKKRRFEQSGFYGWLTTEEKAQLDKATQYYNQLISASPIKPTTSKKKK